MENKNKPHIRFKAFEEDWEHHFLGDILNITSAARVHKNEWTEKGVPFFRSSDVVADFKRKENSKAFISFELYEQLSKKTGSVQKNDLLVTGGGSIGIPFLIKSNDPFYFKDADLLWLKNGNNINGHFLYYFFSTSFFRRYVNSITHIGTISHYTIEQAKSTPIKLPKRAEQDKIGECLLNIDQLITEHQQKHSKLKALKQAMLDKMFPKQGRLVPEIRFKGFEGDWANPRLGNIGDPYTGLSGKSKNDFGHGEGRYITYMNVFSNPISDNDEVDKIEIDSSQNEVISGDVLFTVSSETAEEVGMSSVWTGNQKNIYLNSFCFGYRPKVKLDNYFLANLLRTKTFREQMILLAQGISRYNISKNKVMDLTIYIPQFDEQVVIGDYFKNLDSLIRQHNEQITKLSNLKKAFLVKMFV